MFGIPLHPLVVHFPIVLAILLPISAVVALWAVGKGSTVRRAWAVPLVLAAALSLSAFAATQTGDREEDRVERVVPRGALHDHEEAGERFALLSGVLFLIVAVGLARGTFGQAARLLGTVGALALVAAAVQVGHSGGSLVYRHGAASAYATDSMSVARQAASGVERDEGDDH
jgi:uncharacterized membrane protein